MASPSEFWEQLSHPDLGQLVADQRWNQHFPATSSLCLYGWWPSSELLSIMSQQRGHSRRYNSVNVTSPAWREGQGPQISLMDLRAYHYEELLCWLKVFKSIYTCKDWRGIHKTTVCELLCCCDLTAAALIYPGFQCVLSCTRKQTCSFAHFNGQKGICSILPCGFCCISDVSDGCSPMQRSTDSQQFKSIASEPVCSSMKKTHTEEKAWRLFSINVECSSRH